MKYGGTFGGTNTMQMVVCWLIASCRARLMSVSNC